MRLIQAARPRILREAELAGHSVSEANLAFETGSPAERAHRYYVYLQTYGMFHDDEDIPANVAELRRAPLPDEQTDYWRNQLIRNLNKF